MSKDKDLSEVKRGRIKKEALEAFNRLLRTNTLTREDAEMLRKEAYLSDIRSLSAKFLGKMTKGKRIALGWFIAALIFSALIYVNVSNPRSKYRQGTQGGSNQRSIQKTETALEQLVASMKVARKTGLTNNRVLYEESTYPDYDLRLATLKTFALDRSHRYFGTVQFSETPHGDKNSEVYFGSGPGTDLKEMNDFQIILADSAPFMEFHVMGHRTKNNAKTMEYYGSWRSLGRENISGNFIAKQNAESLNIQIFSFENEKIYYSGRVLLKATE